MFLFLKSRYNAILFHLVGQMGTVIIHTLLKTFTKVVYNSADHFMRNGGNFLTNRIFKFFNRSSASLTSILWGYLKSKVYSNRPQSIEELKDAIRQEIASIPHEMIRRVIDNFRERLQQCVDNNGSHLTDLIFKTK